MKIDPELLRRAIDIRTMTLQEMADRARLSRVTLERYRMLERSPHGLEPSEGALLRLAAVLEGRACEMTALATAIKRALRREREERYG